ncbi:hypothetical protein F0562_034264 [Nyssa sinensis]|uniref:Uncharacterized protein n=1 Tax=Nyssa sinensis TaxID=561372 RepID=A0A5J5AIW1_9ASTE|nr:hypothetical protein F0562_034264 [Nyssa sinensis]
MVFVHASEVKPNPKDFPVLAYILSQCPKFRTKPTFQFEFSNSNQYEFGKLFVQMPHFNNPKLKQSMINYVSDVARTGSILHALGPRPHPSAVDTARTKIAVIEFNLSRRLDEIGAMSNGVDWVRKEKELREAAEREVQIYRVVLRLQEMYGAYEKQLRDTEERLMEMYNSAVVDLEGCCEEEFVKVDLEDDVEKADKIMQQATMKAVERIDHSECQFGFPHEAFGKLHGLVILNISHNQLQVIPDAIARLEKLEELNVSSNFLESLPDSIGLLINLKVLNVSGNKLNILPESISQCSALVELDASFNNIMYLPSKIGYGLLSLRKLSIHLNKIRSLPPSVCEIRSLRYLDAHFNELSGLPYAIGRLTKLEVLNLSSNFNNFTGIPVTIGGLTNLKELDLSNNQIQVLPDTFSQLANLTKLNLDQNPLVIPPMEIVSKGVESVKKFMLKRRLNVVAIEEQRRCLKPKKRG